MASTKRYLLAGLGALVALLGVIWGGLRFMFWEPSDIEKGSLTYLLKVPGAAKRFPIWSAIGNVTYDVPLDNGVSPPVVLIHYVSRASEEELVRAAEGCGLTCKRGGDTELFCESPSEGHKTQAFIAVSSSGSNVKVITAGK